MKQPLDVNDTYEDAERETVYRLALALAAIANEVGHSALANPRNNSIIGDLVDTAVITLRDLRKFRVVAKERPPFVFDDD